jgi:bifunctional DNA-binding transcriptional regulator/antitoxin component of YhaV-PrlF toxin-antitoxin module
MKGKILQVRGRGTLTLPVRARQRYGLEEGDPLTFLDLDGVMVLVPRVGVVPKLAAQIEAEVEQAGLTPDELVAEVQAERRSSRGRR